MPGTTEPQRGQNGRGRASGAAWKRRIFSAPRSQRNAAAGADTKLANAAPCALRHIEQWQWATRLDRTVDLERDVATETASAEPCAQYTRAP